MIKMLVPMSVGNAVRGYLVQPSGTKLVRVLRKLGTGAVFSGPSDPLAVVAYEGKDSIFVDVLGLLNGMVYAYQAFYFDGVLWPSSSVAEVSTSSDYADASVDAPSLLRDRIDFGMQEEVRRSMFNPEGGVIRVLTAPPIYESVRWPLVTVQIKDDGSNQRAIGEQVSPDESDAFGAWSEVEGWLSRCTCSVVGWSQNPDERANLRKALRRIVVANLPVFDDAGMVQIEFSQTDTEDFNSYPAPIYQTIGTFSCLAPVSISSGHAPSVASVTSQVII